jgi:predicted nucleic acid-binding protein
MFYYYKRENDLKLKDIHQSPALLPLARRFKLSAYDAAYLALAEKTGEPLITGDERLFNTVHGQEGWVVWIGEYSRLP